jgi:hypothetical protein
MKQSFFKILSDNDVGATGSHQAGVAIPKSNKGLMEFFPFLDPNKKNPEAMITCIDPDQVTWKLRYIYYNGKLLGTSTRNEYRLTHTSKFLKVWGAKSGDQMLFESTPHPSEYLISIKKRQSSNSSEKSLQVPLTKPTIIKLKGWHRVY